MLGYLIFSMINFIMLIGLLVYFSKKPVKSYFSSRSCKLIKTRTEILDNLSKATDDYNKSRSKFEKVDHEMDRLIKNAEREGESAVEKLLHQTEKMADQVLDKLKTRTDEIVSGKNMEIYSDIVEKSFLDAENAVKQKINYENNVLIGKDFLKRLAENLSVKRSINNE